MIGYVSPFSTGVMCTIPEFLAKPPTPWMRIPISMS